MSLFSLCVDFVASNIHLVESFTGFPDSVGKKIFNEAIMKEQFKNVKDCSKAQTNLKIFFDAYNQLGILTSLCLHQSHLFVNDALSVCPWLFKDLTSLDLSFCGLGDDHELLPQITSCLRLEVLNLQCNCLTDDGVRALTTPLRFHRKIHCLKYIDLSSNKITVKCLHFLKMFTTLCAIDASNTSVIEMGSLKVMDNFSFHNTCACCDSLCKVTTQGWAKVIVDSWKQAYDKCRSPLFKFSASETTSGLLSDKATEIDAKYFYSRRKPDSVSHPYWFDGNKRVANKLILITKFFHCDRETNCTSADDVCNQKYQMPSPPSLHPPLKGSRFVGPSVNNDTKKIPPTLYHNSSTQMYHCDNKFKRKANDDTSQRKKKCVLQDKIKMTIRDSEEYNTNIMASGDNEKTLLNSHSSSMIESSDDFLALYSSSSEGCVDSENICRRVMPSKRLKLVDELELMF